MLNHGSRQVLLVRKPGQRHALLRWVIDRSFDYDERTSASLDFAECDSVELSLDAAARPTVWCWP
jgi:hypothetical protein